MHGTSQVQTFSFGDGDGDVLCRVYLYPLWLLHLSQPLTLLVHTTFVQTYKPSYSLCMFCMHSLSLPLCVQCACLAASASAADHIQRLGGHVCVKHRDEPGRPVLPPILTYVLCMCRAASMVSSLSVSSFIALCFAYIRGDIPLPRPPFCSFIRLHSCCLFSSS